MSTVRCWTGTETRAMRLAMRMSVRGFAAHLGVAQRTISNWEAGGAHAHPGPDSQAILDTVLSRADAEVRERFALLLGTPQNRARRQLRPGRALHGAEDDDTWAEDLDRCVAYLARQNFSLAEGLLQRWLVADQRTDDSGLYLRARSLALLGDCHRDQGKIVGPLSAHQSYRLALGLFQDLGAARCVAQAELSLAVIVEMSGGLEEAARRYQKLANDVRLSPRDRARSHLWVGTALSKHGEHDHAAATMAEAAQLFEDLEEPEDWSVAHQKLALAHRGAGQLDQALHHIGIALAAMANDSPLQRVRLHTAHAHILVTDARTYGQGMKLLDDSGDLAVRYGLKHQLHSMETVRRDAEHALRTRNPTGRPL